MVKKSEVTAVQETWARKKAYARVLAAFDTPIEGGYLNLLEGLFIILLGTLEKPMFSHKFVRPCVWSFIEEIRERIDIPWGKDTLGLNLAFPLVQGFFNKGADEMSPCVHCGMMTGSHKHRTMMEGTEESLHASTLGNLSLKTDAAIKKDEPQFRVGPVLAPKSFTIMTRQFYTQKRHRRVCGNLRMVIPRGQQPSLILLTTYVTSNME
ncbi:hypothetical protein N7471_009671 [Penicillium samsonianum]|uniref:uncharacterized protein n=1 Tax=Penicillium samsonianum TaxID=1882272 RepID=UPI0025482C38|nr:uncharacterized protein N7471_009671 [Penicillium samsonianum]KAJ6128454.1 hypothetical protein N7471_009671 [Penicillium samsonianum]